MNLALFGYRSFAMGSLVAFIYGTALFGSTYLIPVYMQLGLYDQTVKHPLPIPNVLGIGVAGLLTGQDIQRQLAGQDLGAAASCRRPAGSRAARRAWGASSP